MSAVAERVSELEDFRLWANELRNDRIAQRAERPWIRLWDGDWNYRGQCASELSGDFQWKSLETGSGSLKLPIDLDDERGTFLAFWILEEEERGTRNVHITVDKNGARWGGRQRKAKLHRDPKGDYVEVTFAHDYEELKNVHIAPNPFLPLGLIQVPKIFMLFCRTKYGAALSLFLNLLRLQFTNIDIGTDPLNPATWGGIDFWDWQIVVKPQSLADDVSPFTFFNGKMKSWHDMCAAKLEDAEITPVLRRYLTGDPPPWEGAPELRNGTLVVDFVDNSGFRSGTSIGGNLATGLARTIAGLTDNAAEDSYDLLTGEIIPDSRYRVANVLCTYPENPYVIYRDGDITGIEVSDFERTASGPARITAGGQSIPGVNEIISAAVNYAGDVVGDNISFQGYGIGSLGSTIDSFANPIYKDCVLPWTSIPLPLRAAEDGWGHYLETIASGTSQAYTPTVFVEIRKRRRETDPDTSCTLTVSDAAPWLIGDEGEGHWFLDSRVGFTNKYLGARVWVKRAREISLAWSDTSPVEWQGKLADSRPKLDGLDRGLSLLQDVMGSLQDAGVM